MAQAVFDDHPLGEYLRDAGEIAEVMPGISSELTIELDPSMHLYPVDEDDPDIFLEWRPSLLIQLLDTLYSIFELVQPTKSPNPFAERFKYDIISSSLLATTFKTPHHRSVRTPPIPGKLKLTHSRSASLESNPPPPPPPIPSTPQEPSYITPSITVIAVAFFYLTGHTFLALLSLAAVAVLLHSLYVMHDSPKLDMTPCLISLNELIAASDTWGSVVREAIANVEMEEEGLLYGTAFPATSPTSSIRVALHSSLLTTQTQCDNVRQLFSALTCATELSQLSEMYAPTPWKPAGSPPDANPRPLSLSASQRRDRLSDPKFNKRSTWNGSYTCLADQVGPLPQVLRRRGKRRSDLTSLLHVTSPKQAHSAPVTPFTSPNVSLSGKLPGVPEAVFAEEGPTLSMEAPDEGTESFSAAALALSRSRKTEALDIFVPFSASALSPHRQSPPFTSSRLSPLQNSRHPLSLSAVQTLLHASLASKRYACSHLLALRFSEDEDEGYWEDVRSVMGLLTTTFSDASSRLMQALADHEQSKLHGQPLTPLSEADSFQDILRSPTSDTFPPRRMQVPELSYLTSFAPTPGPFARFAAHVTAISSALEDARENLESCIQVLKEESSSSTPPSRRQSDIPEVEGDSNPPDEHPALQAYERLRREIGLALRECERGRERLLEIVKPPVDSAAHHDSDSEGIPGLAHDTSDRSDKPEPHSSSEGEEGNITMDRLAVFIDSKINDDGGLGRDDVTEHLLLSASPQHLPPSLGIEQVFETDAAAAGFARERSKLTREERIKLVKARRESVASVRHPSTPRENEGVEKWGPGGEVVQELKDVIWKVGERRRKFADGLRKQSLDFKVDPQVPATIGVTHPWEKQDPEIIHIDDAATLTPPYDDQDLIREETKSWEPALVSIP